MTAILLRVVIYAVIAGAVWWGVRRIWLDWRNRFRDLDTAQHKATRQRDLAERARPDVITLKRDKDGTYRPPDE